MTFFCWSRRILSASMRWIQRFKKWFQNAVSYNWFWNNRNLINDNGWFLVFKIDFEVLALKFIWSSKNFYRIFFIWIRVSGTNLEFFFIFSHVVYISVIEFKMFWDSLVSTNSRHPRIGDWNLQNWTFNFMELSSEISYVDSRFTRLRNMISSHLLFFQNYYDWFQNQCMCFHNT